jgi:hypothetical protein
MIEIIFNPNILPTKKEWQLICEMVKQQRELTDEEIISEWIGNDRNYYNFARAILQKASEK